MIAADVPRPSKSSGGAPGIERTSPPVHPRGVTVVEFLRTTAVLRCVAVREDGVPSFNLLQNFARRGLAIPFWHSLRFRLSKDFQMLGAAMREQPVWLMTEHTGLPHEGTILNRTRTMHTSAFVRWWLWNMNYHAEHHAWPAVPWNALPMLHQHIASHLEHQSWGYCRLQLEVLHRTNLPDGVPPMAASE